MTPGGQRLAPRVLIADDDADIARFIELNLVLEGFEVSVVHDGQRALESALADPPDLVLLDVMMPHLDGVEVVHRLRATPATCAVPIVMLTARSLSADKVVALTAGADDYIVKPFDTLELVARVRTTLRRTADLRSVSPLTGLPGNTRIEREVVERAHAGRAYAVCHVDLDEFKSFNDAYGFVRGDGLLRDVATHLQSVVAGSGEPPAFLGHIGGDDFVLVCTPEQVDPLCAGVVRVFDEIAPAHYDPADAERGHLEVKDRRGELRKAPLVTISVGVAVTEGGSDRDHREVVAAAAEMKTVAKGSPGSAVAVDRRG